MTKVGYSDSRTRKNEIYTEQNDDTIIKIEWLWLLVPAHMEGSSDDVPVCMLNCLIVFVGKVLDQIVSKRAGMAHTKKIYV